MILSAFTLFHVILSLIGIGAGFVAVYSLLTDKRLESWTTLFLGATVATSVTGYLFPFHGVTPAHIVGLISLMLLGAAIVARRQCRLTGNWGRTYAIASVLSLYLNVFVLVVQLFQKVPVLKALAPTQSEPPFQIVQFVVLVVFLTLTVLAAKKLGHRSLQTA